MKKKEEKQVDRVEVDFKFKAVSKNINKAIDEFDQRIEEQLSKAIQFKKTNRIEEEERARKKIGMLLQNKLRRMDQLDKLEATRDRIMEMIDDMELARTLGNVYSGIGSFIDKKEMKNILNEINSFNATMSKAETNINVLMSSINDKIGVEENPQVDAMIQSQYDRMMESYEKRIEEESNLEEDEFVLR